mgnify:FL=1
MIKPIVKDIFFLKMKGEIATPSDQQVIIDLQDTRKAHQDHCVGMAANMIGYKKRIIIVSLGFINMIMINPKYINKSNPYTTEEGCQSLTGTRKTTRYKDIEITYLDTSFKPHTQKYTGYIAQIIQHEMDHLEGIII